MEGTVKFFNRRKGFGFILGEDSKDYFVHFTALPRGVFLRENDKVSFESAEGDRGLKAEKVQLLQKGSERAGAEESHSHQGPSHAGHSHDGEESEEESFEETEEKSEEEQ